MITYHLSPVQNWTPVECRKFNRREKRMAYPVSSVDHECMFFKKDTNTYVTLRTCGMKHISVLDMNKLYVVRLYNHASKDYVYRISDRPVAVYSEDDLDRIYNRWKESRRIHFENNPPKSLFETLMLY